MPKNHVKFHSVNGKRLVLVADDEMINREILGAILREDYEIIYACDGQETIEKMRENKDTLSLVLLDVLMPKKTGIEVLSDVRSDADLSRIPVIVLTSESDTEVESLQLGAIDFIPKPYPNREVIQARVLRTIELSEDRDIIQSTERDPLTGLYNKEYFYRYAQQYDQFHKDKMMDAIVIDINHFHMINERYGNAYGDEVLTRIGERVRELVRDEGGIVCRKEADTFLVYCPHREDYKKILESASSGLSGDELANNRVRLRMGVYTDADKSLDIERRFDRAKTAADTVKNSFTKTIGIYNDDLHEREMYAEQLIEDFSSAITNQQFQIYYQPKFDVTSDVPILCSAEALVRWFHPKLGMVSPGVFIPLFEENGLIEKLDLYVWDKTAEQIARWKEEFEYAIPVSVNVSRIDMYDPQLVENLQGILKKHGLSCEDLVLEVTESAYTENSSQIIETVERLRELGFKIEMDDFGTGYSSLHMISSLPIDAMKVDMQFIRNAFKEGGNTRMLEVIIDIADFLNVPVIAEGVETEYQLDQLRKLGCEIVQGYFFSKPVPSEEFEPFILQRKEALKNTGNEPDIESTIKEAQIDKAKNTFSKIDEVEDAYGEKGKAFQLRTANIAFAVLAFLASVILFAMDVYVAKGYVRMQEASDRYIQAQTAASDMESASDYLTDCVRSFVVTGDMEYLNEFFEEVNVTKKRDQAVQDLEDLLGGENTSALDSLNKALDLSNELLKTEYKAMRLVLQSQGSDLSKVPEEISEVVLSQEELSMSEAELKEKAQSLVFDSEYMLYKDRIRDNVSMCTRYLISSSSQELQLASDQLTGLVNLQGLIMVIFLLIVVGMVALISLQVRTPLTRMVKKMQENEPIVPTGVEELRFVSRTYNKILKENRSTQDRLSFEASHDALTGLFNRGAYELLIQNVEQDHMAMLIVDVDHFKQINDTYGHAVGDKVLKKVAELLKHSFRSVDIICRFGGDEFVVVMTRVNSSMRQLVENKISQLNTILKQPEEGQPEVSLSVGVAFSDRHNPQGTIFEDADAALYRIKEAGGNGCGFYGA